MKWSYGVTTVPGRQDDLLPRTLASLAAAGFNEPRLFVDGEGDQLHWRRKFHGLSVTVRQPSVKAFGNWLLGMWELHLREPHADRYAMFQDDLIAVKHLRRYLEQCGWPSPSGTGDRGAYLNLYTFSTNEQIIAGESPGTWHEAGLILDNNRLRRQTGRGALALVFEREGLRALLSAKGMVMKLTELDRPHKGIDGTVVTVMNAAGWREHVHQPSLVRHTGLTSAIRSADCGTEMPCPYAPDQTFPGEHVDAMEFLSGKQEAEKDRQRKRA